MNIVKIKKLKENAILPEKQTVGASGYDIFACVESSVMLKSGERALIPAGISMEIPSGMEAQVRPRSGLAVKHGITVLNAPGTIDSDYRGELAVILINLSDTDYIIENGMRIAQLVIQNIPASELVETSDLNETSRGIGGFGSTGVK